MSASATITRPGASDIVQVLTPLWGGSCQNVEIEEADVRTGEKGCQNDPEDGKRKFMQKAREVRSYTWMALGRGERCWWNLVVDENREDREKWNVGWVR